VSQSVKAHLGPVEEVPAPARGWQLIYDGQWQEPVNGSRLDARSPIDGSLIETIPNADVDDVDRAVKSAAKAAAEWARVTPKERARVLEALSRRLLAEAERFAWLDTINVGMPIAAARQEAVAAAERLPVWAHIALEIKGDTFGDARGLWGYTQREPYGVVSPILAFNHPILFFIDALGPTLSAGNSVIIKPAERASLSALAIAEAAQDVLPDGLVNVISGEGPTAGQALCRHPGIPRVAFTGSVATGRQVLVAAADHIKHVTLELGGKNPLVILPDADIDLAVRMAVGGMNLRGVAGQSCRSCSRVLVHESRHDEFVSALVDEVRAIRVGDPRSEDTEMGSLAFREHFERVLNYVEVGVSEGATLLTGGGVPSGLEAGYFIEPTVFADVTPRMRLAQEEIFGPVISVMRWRDRDEVLDIANGVEYGLTGRIACGSLGEGLDLASGLQAGLLWINEPNGGPERMPFGGYKQSGLGKQGSFDELLSYTREKAVTVRVSYEGVGR
jgi:betaine-aldehyde dehydrogenase